MMRLFDDEQIMRTYLKDAADTAAYEADRAAAEQMLKKEKCRWKYCRLRSDIIF